MPSAYDTLILGTSGLVSFWELNETSISGGSTTATDSADSNNGTYDGTETGGQTGIGDGETGVLFNGSTGYVSVTAGTNITGLGNGPWSLEAWVKLSATGNQSPIFGSSTSSGSVEVRVNSSNKIELLAQNTASIAASTSTISDTTTWHHVVVTNDGTSSNNTSIKIYLDSVNVTPATFTYHTLAFTNAFNIGAASGIGEYIHGSLAKIAIYNVALSSTTVSQHYNWNSSSPVPLVFCVVSQAVNRSSTY